MEILKELQAWYGSHVNDHWEHEHGITIESTDNPGWWVKVQLSGTSLVSKPFSAVSMGSSEDSAIWLRCYVQDDVFHGAGDVGRLEEILRRFLEWVKET